MDGCRIAAGLWRRISRRGDEAVLELRSPRLVELELGNARSAPVRTTIAGAKVVSASSASPFRRWLGEGAGVCRPGWRGAPRRPSSPPVGRPGHVPSRLRSTAGRGGRLRLHPPAGTTFSPTPIFANSPSAPHSALRTLPAPTPGGPRGGGVSLLLLSRWRRQAPPSATLSSKVRGPSSTPERMWQWRSIRASSLRTRGTPRARLAAAEYRVGLGFTVGRMTQFLNVSVPTTSTTMAAVSSGFDFGIRRATPVSETVLLARSE